MRARFVNETINFERREDSLSSLGIAQRKLIEDWLDEIGIREYEINKDMSIDVDGCLNLFDMNLTKIPEFIQFNNIRFMDKFADGWFSCSYNKLTSLRGCPRHTDSDFYCSDNKITFTNKDVSKLCKVDGKIVC